MSAIGIDIGGTAVKAALFDGRGRLETACSASYVRPDRVMLVAAVKEALGKLAGGAASVQRVGLCLPGRHHAAGDRIELAVNVPGLEGYLFEELVADAVGRNVPHIVVSDAEAATLDAASDHPDARRVLGIAIGTGVGACLMEDGRAVRIGRGSGGHLGQCDVGPIGGTHPLGPDGGRGSLEAYLGVAAFRARFGAGFGDRIASLPADDPALVALARAIRIALAIYTPDLVLLLGGLGIALEPHRKAIEGEVRLELTRVAPAGWRLAFGTSRFHAAVGAARLALAYPDPARTRN